MNNKERFLQKLQNAKKIKSGEYKDETFTIQVMESVYAPVNLTMRRQFKNFSELSEKLQHAVNYEKTEIEHHLLNGRKLETASEYDMALIKSPNRHGRPLMMFNGGHYYQNGSSAGSNLDYTQLIMVDIDDTPYDVEYIEMIVKYLNLDAIMISSLRHKPNKTKLHLIFTTTEKITDSKTYKATWRALDDIFKSFDVTIDNAVSDWTRRIYLASSGLYKTFKTGKAITPLEDTRINEYKPTTTSATLTGSKGDILAKAAIQVATASNGERNNTLNRVLYTLKNQGFAEAELRKVAKASNVESESERAATFKSATGFDY